MKLKMYRNIYLTILHLYMKYETCTLKTIPVIASEPKCWQNSVVTLTFDPKMYGYLPLTILHLGMKYENYTLKTTQVIVSVQKCWQSSVVTLTFDLLIPKCISINLSPSCIYVWNMKPVHWKLVKLSCQNQSVDKVPLWPWPLTFFLQNVWVSSCCHPASIYEIWKIYNENYPSSVIISEPKC